MSDDERTPEEWRELLKATYDYPEETDDGSRRQRRRARKAWRKTERARTTAWIAQERRREPTTARAAFVVVAALLAVGVLTRVGPDWLSTRADPPKATAQPNPTAAPSGDDKPPAPTSTSPTAAPSSADAVDLTDPNAVAEQFIRHYLTRNPPEDGDHRASVRRAAPWATPALSENLAAHEDRAFAVLVSRGGVATVRKVTIGPTPQGLPADTPLRVWRAVTATVDVAGYTNYTDTVSLKAEITDTGRGWRVARLLGL
ncbi:hypothetical protein [Streptomyces hydrogenans]